MRRSLVLLAVLPLAACAAPAAPPVFAPPRLPFMGPTHEPTTSAQWSQLEARARDSAASGGRLQSSFRLTAADAHASGAERTLEVATHTCYAVGVAWSFAAKASVDVMFLPGAGGRRPNARFASQHFELDPEAGRVTFCADDAGRVTLHVQALTSDRVIINDELLEYAIAIASHEETRHETAVRQHAEADRAAQDSAAMEINVVAGETQRYGVAFARSCARCRELARACLKDDRRSESRCGTEFETCAQAVGTDSYGRILCAPPGR
jgi:hypothetical protein